MQDAVNQAVITLTIEGSKLTGKALAAAIKLLLAAIDKQKHKIYHGEQSVKQLLKQGEQLQTLPLNDVDLAAFHRIMKSYGVDYAVKPVLNAEGQPIAHTLFLKGSDAELIQSALKEYMAYAATQEQTKDRESLQSRLDRSKAETITLEDFSPEQVAMLRAELKAVGAEDILKTTADGQFRLEVNSKNREQVVAAYGSFKQRAVQEAVTEVLPEQLARFDKMLESVENPVPVPDAVPVMPDTVVENPIPVVEPEGNSGTEYSEAKEKVSPEQSAVEQTTIADDATSIAAVVPLEITQKEATMLAEELQSAGAPDALQPILGADGNHSTYQLEITADKTESVQTAFKSFRTKAIEDAIATNPQIIALNKKLDNLESKINAAVEKVKASEKSKSAPAKKAQERPDRQIPTKETLR